MIKYVDLFAGIGGFRCGIDAFAAKHSRTFHCVKSVDIKKDAIKAYNHIFRESNEQCDIRTVKDLPPFDLLCAGFPCQPFSSAGNKKGLNDEGRGNLIYEVIRICRESKPTYLLLENVSNIETIDKGETLKKITGEFEALGYHITCCSINSSEVGLAQDRKRLFIVGSLLSKPVITVKAHAAVRMKDIIDAVDTVTQLPAAFVGKLLALPRDDVIGKSIKDKRGGDSNIHSWDIDYHGKISDRQKALLNRILLERRKKKWAAEKNMAWMDGIPLSLHDIQSFLNYDGLEADLADAVEK
jgi:DNA (cytosine-5)-methyltransferase 1